MMHRLFKHKLSSPENVILKYVDDEGDLVSMEDDTDVNHAISQSRLLKITVSDKKHRAEQDKEQDDAAIYLMADLQAQLTALRDTLNKLLEQEQRADRTAIKPPSPSSTREKTYRQLSAAELAEFEERQQQQLASQTSGPAPQHTASLSPQRPPPSATPTNLPSHPTQHPAPPRPSGSVHASAPPPFRPSATGSSVYPLPEQQQQQQQQQQQGPPSTQPFHNYPVHPPRQPHAPAYPPRPPGVPQSPMTGGMPQGWR
ncbi:hypothetical protein BCR43DRAFT_482154 [Syncephalastrum racemosum]|uniref:PB1 domain-containing protein n=1 Tax=Syncephalastrum racemosum TaxID=13706 RepID=A0A1X2HT55_SYNRA|nr:hypothetical protein BCR43DRAFT_482154 [Syncephalastrum racemosum]